MIEAVTYWNLQEVLPLIRRYQEFYNVPETSESNNEQFFSRFGEDTDLGCLFIFRQNDVAVGFATVYFSYASTIIQKVAVLNDLYTVPKSRRNGIAKQLIEHCKKFAAQKGAARLQWVTALDNEPAQKLYALLPISNLIFRVKTYLNKTHSSGVEDFAKPTTQFNHLLLSIFFLIF